MRAFKAADILIPENVDLTKWSVVACDQYTSEPKYWEDVEALVGSSPSAFHIIFPEIYLEDADCDERIESINKTMKKYLDEGIFRTLSDTFVYVKRTLKNGKVRRGLVGAVDLEEYDFTEGSTSPVRATEGTVLERIPPRVKIRKNAVLESPHIMLLIDDEKMAIIEPLEECISTLEKIYDFELMKDGGHLQGYKLGEKEKNMVYAAIDRLAAEKSGENVPVFAVGDGNHSLASAKTHWENVKKDLTKEEAKNHPARFALAELVNIHDESLEFEPIHRVVFGCNPEKLLSELFKYYDGASAADNGGQHIKYMHGEVCGDIYIKDSPSQLAVGTLQKFLDEYESKSKIDYIHGEDVVEKLSKESSNIGFILPPMKKSHLFVSVAKDGALPRKTFSMGDAREKRFYLECKKITKSRG